MLRIGVRRIHCVFSPFSPCSTTRRGVVLGAPGEGRVDAARGWQAGGRAARPPRRLGRLRGAAWAAVGGRVTAPGPGGDGSQGAAGRRGYMARARRRVVTPGAATSGEARRPRSPSSVRIALGDLSRIALSCIGWSVAWANSHKGNWASATLSVLFRTMGDDGGRHRRRRQVNRAFCLAPLAAPLPGSGDPIGARSWGGSGGIRPSSGQWLRGCATRRMASASGCIDSHTPWSVGSAFWRRRIEPDSQTAIR